MSIINYIFIILLIQTCCFGLAPKHIKLIDSDHKLAELKRMDKDQGISVAPYLYSNEHDYDNAISNLESVIIDHGDKSRVHIGVSGLQNVDMIAARDSDFGIMIDINTRTQALFKLVEDIFLSDPFINGKDFYVELLKEVKKQSKYYFKEEGDWDRELSNLKKYLEENATWIKDENKFKKIKKMFLEGRITSIRMDLSDNNYFRVDGELKNNFNIIKDWLEANNATLDSLYLSNSFDEKWTDNKERSNYLRNIDIISNEKTIVLDSHYGFYIRSFFMIEYWPKLIDMLTGKKTLEEAFVLSA